MAQTTGACCLNNQIIAGGLVQSAEYDPATSRTRICFSDGSIISKAV